MTPKQNTNKQALTPFDSVDPSDFDSAPLNKRMSNPRIVKPSRTGGRLKSKMAAAFENLYDEAEESLLQSPICTYGSMEVLPPSNIIDLTTPEPTSVRSADQKGKASSHTNKTGTRPGLTSVAEEAGDNMDVDGAVGDSGAMNAIEVRSEWVGTTQFLIEQNVELQRSGQIQNLISYLRVTQYESAQNPYDPSANIELSRILNKIGFTDIGSSKAYRAILLLEGYRLRESNIHPHVQEAMSKRLRTQSPLIIDDEVKTLHLHAYRELLNGLLGCGCFWEGATEVAKRALDLFPGDPEVLETRKWLMDGFKDRHEGLKTLGADPRDLVVRSRMGKIYQKPYPWMDGDLYKRKPALVRKINENFGAGNCRVRSVIFGSPAPSQLSPKEGEHQDVGPLGVFATQDIKEGELVLVDQCLTVVSDVPSSRLEHCDACHASLKAPFQNPSDTIEPKCCKKVAFCSHACHATAVNGYHSVVCGKDFDWLYKPSPEVSAGAGYKWHPKMFVRYMAIIIADRKVEIKAGKKPTHPLQHPLMARMTTNCSPAHKLHPDSLNDWTYNENIVAPTKILMLLGIDIFADPDFSQEAIQTMYWRMQNNANMSIVDLSLNAPKLPYKGGDPLSASQRPSESSTNKTTIQMICLNPSYLFFNHSCDPNLSWHGAIPDPWVAIDWITGYNGEVLKPGCSAVFCRASRDIKKGEELTINYVGDPKGDSEGGGREIKRNALKKWFEGGCGCELCVKENGEYEKRKRESDGEEIDIDIIGKLVGQI